MGILKLFCQVKEVTWSKKKLKLVVSMDARSLLGRNPTVVDEEEDEEWEEICLLFSKSEKELFYVWWKIWKQKVFSDLLIYY